MRRSRSQLDLLAKTQRSNSPLPFGRERASSAQPDIQSPADEATFGFFSREASRHFAHAYVAKNEHGVQATKRSQKNLSAADQAAVSDRKGRQKVVGGGAGLGSQFSALVENKATPHFFIVAEGAADEQQVDVDDTLEPGKPVKHAYGRGAAIKGATKSGGKDAKQDMAFYVRKDLEDVYTPKKTVISHEKGDFPVMSVSYSTDLGGGETKNFEHLFVHIPNALVGGSAVNKKAHAAFQAYADAQALKGITVTGYSGDTNYRTPHSESTVPSMGGQLPSGRSLVGDASGSNSDTHFMQSIPLTSKAGTATHALMRPSMTNLVLPPDGTGSKIAVDHPSFIGRIRHENALIGRNPDANAAYYPIAGEDPASAFSDDDEDDGGSAGGPPPPSSGSFGGGYGSGGYGGGGGAGASSSSGSTPSFAGSGTFASQSQLAQHPIANSFAAVPPPMPSFAPKFGSAPPSGLHAPVAVRPSVGTFPVPKAFGAPNAFGSGFGGSGFQTMNVPAFGAKPFGAPIFAQDQDDEARQAPRGGVKRDRSHETVTEATEAELEAEGLSTRSKRAHLLPVPKPARRRARGVGRGGRRRGRGGGSGKTWQ